MLPPHFTRPFPTDPSGSAPPMYRRSSYSPPRVDSTVRRPSALRESRSACDLIDNDSDDANESGNAVRTAGPSSSQRTDWQPETSPTESEGSDSSMTSSTESLTASEDECLFDQDYFGASSNPASTSTCHSKPSSSAISTPKLLAPRPSSNRRRPCGLSITPLAPASESTNKAPSSLLSTGLLPKAQPLGRTLFNRMADMPHAGMGAPKKLGGKQKMIVATKPMRTTFELGLTSKELARRA